jgi:hypothetical protein
MWNRRHSNAPCDKEIPREWSLDTIYFAMKANERTASAYKTFRYKPLLLASRRNSSGSLNLGFHTCGCPRK